MTPVLPALEQVGADILSCVTPTPKPSGWLTGIGLKKKTAKLFQLVRLSFYFLVCFLAKEFLFTL
jgi:hypothetical protein